MKKRRTASKTRRTVSKADAERAGMAWARSVQRERVASEKLAREIATADRTDGSLLKARTKRSRVAWMQLVNGAIAKHSRASRDPDHGETQVLKWVADVAKAVQDTAPQRGRYDGNMREAMVLSLVLALWFSRVQRAKAYDPRRPVWVRRAALARWREFWREMLDAAVNEVDDPEVFSGQHWDPPWSPHAHDGVFL
jgi:hypothetical protein